MRGPVTRATKKVDLEGEEGEEDEDPEMEKFANDIIEKEMRKMNK